LLEDVVLKIHVPDGVVEQIGMEASPQAEPRPAAYDDEGDTLGKGAGYGVVNAEAAHAVGYADGTEARYAGVPVGGISGVQLVAGVDEVDGAFFDQVEKGKHVVARNPESVLQIKLLQTADKVSTDR